VNVDQERAAGHDLRLPLAAWQQAAGRLLGHRSYSRHSRRSGEDAPNRGNRRRPRLAQSKRIRSWLLKNAYSDWLKLEFAHLTYLSGAIGKQVL
jgi:hypothetical protein